MPKLILTSCCVALLGAAAASMASEPAKPAAPAKTETPRASCARQTGTRLVLKDKQCISAPTRSYSGDQLIMTGAQNTAAALKKLDPSLR